MFLVRSQDFEQCHAQQYPEARVLRTLQTNQQKLWQSLTNQIAPDQGSAQSILRQKTQRPSSEFCQKIANQYYEQFFLN